MILPRQRSSSQASIRHGSGATALVCMPTLVVITFLTAKGSAEELRPLTLLCEALNE